MNSEVIFWIIFLIALLISWKMAYSLYVEINLHMHDVHMKKNESNDNNS